MGEYVAANEWWSVELISDAISKAASDLLLPINPCVPAADTDDPAGIHQKPVLKKRTPPGGV